MGLLSDLIWATGKARSGNNFYSMAYDAGIDQLADDPGVRALASIGLRRSRAPELRDAFYPRVETNPNIRPQPTSIGSVEKSADLISDLRGMDPGKAEKIFQQRMLLKDVKPYKINDLDAHPSLAAASLSVPSSGKASGGRTSPGGPPASSSGSEHSVSGAQQEESTRTATPGSGEPLFSLAGVDIDKDQAGLLSIPLVAALLGGLTAPGGKPLGGTLMGGTAGAALAALLYSKMKKGK